MISCTDEFRLDNWMPCSCWVMFCAADTNKERAGQGDINADLDDIEKWADASLKAKMAKRKEQQTLVPMRKGQINCPRRLVERMLAAEMDTTASKQHEE